MHSHFSRLADAAARWLGSAWAFYLALLSVVVWGVSGPYFRYSDNWQLTINTGTTIITFLMVFIIQETQNRSTAAINLKLDELVRVTDAARNDLIKAEKLTEMEIEKLAAK